MSLKVANCVSGAVGLIIARMLTNMDETKLRTLAQLQEFLDATPEVSIEGATGDGDAQRYVEEAVAYAQIPNAQRTGVKPLVFRSPRTSRQLSALIDDATQPMTPGPGLSVSEEIQDQR